MEILLTAVLTLAILAILALLRKLRKKEGPPAAPPPSKIRAITRWTESHGLPVSYIELEWGDGIFADSGEDTN